MLSNKEIEKAMTIRLDAELPEYPAFVEGVRRDRKSTRLNSSH